jgi:hypothetical protein
MGEQQPEEGLVVLDAAIEALIDAELARTDIVEAQGSVAPVAPCAATPPVDEEDDDPGDIAIFGCPGTHSAKEQAANARKMVKWQGPVSPVLRSLSKKAPSFHLNGRLQVAHTTCNYTGFAIEEYTPLPVHTEEYGCEYRGHFTDLNCALAWLMVRREEGQITQAEFDHHHINLDIWAGHKVAAAGDARMLSIQGGRIANHDAFHNYYCKVRCTAGLRGVHGAHPPPAAPAPAPPPAPVHAPATHSTSDMSAAAAAPAASEAQGTKEVKPRAPRFHHHVLVRPVTKDAESGEEKQGALQGREVAALDSPLGLLEFLSFASGGFQGYFDKESGAVVVRGWSPQIQKGVAKMLDSTYGIKGPVEQQVDAPNSLFHLAVPHKHLVQFARKKASETKTVKKASADVTMEEAAPVAKKAKKAVAKKKEGEKKSKKADGETTKPAKKQKAKKAAEGDQQPKKKKAKKSDSESSSGTKTATKLARMKLADA